MMRWILCLTFLLSACVDRRPAPNGSLYIIKNDHGGQIISAEADRAALLKWAGQVRIDGFCNSACVIFTTLPNACLAPNARIGFHAANINVRWVGNPQIAKYLRAGVLAKFQSEWQFVPHEDVHHISAQEYVRLDPQTRLCAS